MKKHLSRILPALLLTLLLTPALPGAMNRAEASSSNVYIYSVGDFYYSVEE